MLTRVPHTIDGTTKECLGIRVLLWCPGCQQIHAPTFRCPVHQGPPSGPVWRGDPNSDPFSMEPSIKVEYGQGWSPALVCHSFIRNGQWQFLDDCTAHELRGFHPLVPLPDWLDPEADVLPAWHGRTGRTGRLLR